MCGIAGIVKMGGQPIFGWQISTLATALEYRGNDATGIALQLASGEVLVLKNNEPAWKFVSSDTFKTFIVKNLTPSVTSVLVHTRKATKGTPYRNENNHPMFNGDAAIVHNGVVANDDALFTDLGLERVAETDSDIIRAIVDEYGIERPALRVLNKMVGWVAASCIHPKLPGHVLLLRSGAPLILGASDDYLMWASDKRALFRALRPWENRFGFLMQRHSTALTFFTLPDDTAALIGPSGRVWHNKFKAATFGRSFLSYNVHNGYTERQARLKEEAAPVSVKVPGLDDIVEAPVDTKPPLMFVKCMRCNAFVDLRINNKQSQQLHLLMCGACKGPLRKPSAGELLKATVPAKQETKNA